MLAQQLHYGGENEVIYSCQGQFTRLKLYPIGHINASFKSTGIRVATMPHTHKAQQLVKLGIG